MAISGDSPESPWPDWPEQALVNARHEGLEAEVVADGI